MRLIDGDKLMVDLIDSDLDHLQRDDWKEVIQIVEDAPTITSEPHWIIVTERLPESAEDDLEYPTVLVCFDNGDVDTACFYESTREWGCGDMYDRICHPIAWMPLPEPYKEVKK